MSLRRPRLLLLSALSALTVAVAAPAGAAAAGCANVSASPSSVSSRTAVRTTVCLVNKERAAHGVRRVRLNRRLSRAAVRHGRDMVRRDYFSHVSPSGSTFLQRIRRTGYLRGARAWSAGENLAWGSDEGATPRSIVRAWMRSPGHRFNMLDGSFREIGVAVVRGAPDGSGGPAATYVNAFGYRR